MKTADEALERARSVVVKAAEAGVTAKKMYGFFDLNGDGTVEVMEMRCVSCRCPARPPLACVP